MSSKQTRKSASEIIAGAIKLFRDGKGWNNYGLHGTTDDGEDTFCAIGGLQKAAFNQVVSSGYTGGFSPRFTSKPDNVEAYEKAHNLIKAAAGIKKSIPEWNDALPAGAKSYVKIKKAFCSALKVALKQEAPKKK